MGIDENRVRRGGYRQSALLMVKAAAARADWVRRPPKGLVILLYHRVGRRTPVEVDLPAALFGEQMALLASTGHAVTIEAGLVAAAHSDSGDRASLVAVTFDDGTADFADVTLPILVEHGVSALVYLATDFIEQQRSFPDDGKPLSWGALRDCLTSGLVTIGSHTHSHLLLDRAGAAEAVAELDHSISLIQDRLGVTPAHFAYPKALLGSAAAQAAVRARFESAAVAGTRPNPYGRTDPYRLHRSPVQVADGMDWFARKLAGGMALEDSLRRVANRRRYAGLTT